MTHIIRYIDADGRPAVGVTGDDRAVRPLAVASLGHLLAEPLTRIRAAVEQAAARPPLTGVAPPTLPPVDGLTEVWASGVTYQRSREARIEESGDGDVYTRVYDAVRPELFFKSVAWRAVGDGAPIGVRADSPSNTPEPELALVLNSARDVVGLTICNDVSSRSIEGDNPLYLPQAKVYTGSCALGPAIRPIWEIDDPRALTIACTINRDNAVVWSATTNTKLLRRTFDDLVEHLFRAMEFPQGVILSTGTGIVPDLDLSLSAGDVVRIEIQPVGALSNPVVTVPAGPHAS
jgi:2-dehydro-3-deoxy-D-arabinonate dehydratase